MLRRAPSPSHNTPTSRHRRQGDIDILTQISALTSALQSVAVGLLEDHLRHCVTDAVRNDGDIEGKIREASQAIARLVR
ncbi:MAG: metal-sensitive transcriptional regulator [Microbacterium sp.]|nr:metal-sensitive transcriptional regulator [Microbacterium sp.]